MSDKKNPIYRPTQFEDALSWNAGHSQGYDEGFKDGRREAEAENKALRELVGTIRDIIASKISSLASCGMIEDEIDDYFAGKDKKNEGSEDGV